MVEEKGERRGNVTKKRMIQVSTVVRFAGRIENHGIVGGAVGVGVVWRTKWRGI